MALKTFLRFTGVFLLLNMVFSQMRVWMHVNMSGWQFIVFILVLALIVEAMVQKTAWN